MSVLIKPQNELLNHWIAFADNFQISPSEFYAELKAELLSRKVPKMLMAEVTCPEGGLLSENRIYLRMQRERILFDICAAPFGTGFFFSCRTSEIGIRINIFQLLFSFSILAAFFVLCVVSYFRPATSILFIPIGVTVFLTTREMLRSNDLDQVLCDNLFIGALY